MFRLAGIITSRKSIGALLVAIVMATLVAALLAKVFSELALS
ncbi:MAG: hypothetical protein AABZ55_12890 [Bdellovibrionota bacterium]